MPLSSSSRTLSRTCTRSWCRSLRTTPWVALAKTSCPTKCNHLFLTLGHRYHSQLRPQLTEGKQPSCTGRPSPAPSRRCTRAPRRPTRCPRCRPSSSSTSRTGATPTFTRASLSSSFAAATSSCRARCAPLAPFAMCSPATWPPPCLSCAMTSSKSSRPRAAPARPSHRIPRPTRRRQHQRRRRTRVAAPLLLLLLLLRRELQTAPLRLWARRPSDEAARAKEDGVRRRERESRRMKCS